MKQQNAPKLNKTKKKLKETPLPVIPEKQTVEKKDKKQNAKNNKKSKKNKKNMKDAMEGVFDDEKSDTHSHGNRKKNGAKF